MTNHWKGVEQYFTVLFNFNQFVILENLSVSDLAVSGAKEKRLLLIMRGIVILILITMSIITITSTLKLPKPKKLLPVD